MARKLIDWLSFTVPIDWEEGVELTFYNDVLWHKISMQMPDGLWPSIFGKFSMTIGKGRPPYRTAYRSDPAGLSVHFNTSLPHVLFEFSGQGCEVLRSAGILDYLMSVVHERVTRIDFAIDWEVPLRPVDFVDAGYGGKFKSTGNVISETGETFYIGSKTSNRYARVYRYEPPHPRHKFLRCEMVLRKEDARETARIASQGNLDTVFDALQDVFRWGHPLWENRGETRMAGHRPERPAGKTERWLIAQCAPAFRKLVENGDIDDPDKWIRTYFLGEEWWTELNRNSTHFFR